MQNLNKGLSKSGFSKRFFFTVILLLLITLSVNIFIDPRGEFGTNILPVVIVATARSEKIQYLKELDPIPNAIVFGSSVCMRYSPYTFNQLTQLKTFNLSVNSGKTEDFLTLLKYLIFELDIHPKLIVLGLSPRSIGGLETEDFDKRLLAIPALQKYIPLSQFSRVYRRIVSIFRSLSIGYFEDDIKSIKAYFNLIKFDPKYVFGKNGFLNIEGNFNKPGLFLSGKIDYPVKEFSDKRIVYLDEFLSLCKMNKIKLKIVLTPYSDEYLSAVQNQYIPIKNRFLKLLESKKGKYDFEIYDFDRVSKFGGVDEFMGAAHPSIFNSSLILEQLFKNN